MRMTILIFNSQKFHFIASANKIRVHSRVELLLYSYTELIREHNSRGIQESTAVFIYWENDIIIHPYPLATPQIALTLRNLSNFSALYKGNYMKGDAGTGVIVKSKHP